MSYLVTVTACRRCHMKDLSVHYMIVCCMPEQFLPKAIHNYTMSLTAKYRGIIWYSKATEVTRSVSKQPHNGRGLTGVWRQWLRGRALAAKASCPGFDSSTINLFSTSPFNSLICSKPSQWFVGVVIAFHIRDSLYTHNL